MKSFIGFLAWGVVPVLAALLAAALGVHPLGILAVYVGLTLAIGLPIYLHEQRAHERERDELYRRAWASVPGREDN